MEKKVKSRNNGRKIKKTSAKEVLEILWELRNGDKFYFMTNGGMFLDIFVREALNSKNEDSNCNIADVGKSVNCEHTGDEVLHQGDGFIYKTCADCGEDI